MPVQYKPPKPQIGQTVQWFPQANRSEEPLAAMVLGYDNTQSISVLVVPMRGKATTKTGVPHIDDPTLERRDARTKDRQGAWNFRPRDGMPMGTGDAEQVIRAMYADGKEATEIAKHLGGVWKHQNVYSYLKKAGLWKEKGMQSEE